MSMEVLTQDEELKLLEIKLNQLKLDYEKYFIGIERQAPGQRHKEVKAQLRRLEDLRIAFEVQLSTTFLDVVLSRREFYRAVRAALVWVLPNFHPNYRRMTDDDILFSNNSNIFVVDESTAAASEVAGSFVIKCWHRKPVIDGGKIVDEWVERLVSWDEIEVDVDLQTVQAFDYSLEAASLAEEIKAAMLARIAAEQAALEQIGERDRNAAERIHQSLPSDGLIDVALRGESRDQALRGRGLDEAGRHHVGRDVLAAHFQLAVLEGGRARFADAAADFRGAGKAHQTYVAMRHQRLAHIAPAAGDDIDDAARDARLVQDLHEVIG